MLSALGCNAQLGQPAYAPLSHDNKFGLGAGLGGLLFVLAQFADE